MIGRVLAPGRAPSPAAASLQGSRSPAGAGLAVPITLPIDRAGVHLVASPGFPLWEPVEVLQLRNHRITLAYADLSRQLANALARSASPQHWLANWCTFATWSSRTIGLSITARPSPPGIPGRPVKPARDRRLADALALAVGRLLGRGHGAIYRSLAVGNRFVFLEVGSAVSCFLEAFGGGEPAGEAAWSAFCGRIETDLNQLAHLDPSWLPTRSPSRWTLLLGLRCYHDAIHTPEPSQRWQLVLAANLLIGAYEQERVQGYLAAALSAFPVRSLRRLVQSGTGALTGPARVLSSLYARAVTRYLLYLQTSDELLEVGRPLPAPPEQGDRRPGASGGDPVAPETVALAPVTMDPLALGQVTLPTLQALMCRYDWTAGRGREVRARDWSRFSDRMSYITNLFRTRRDHLALFDAPFRAEEEHALLQGVLLPAPDR